MQFLRKANRGSCPSSVFKIKCAKLEFLGPVHSSCLRFLGLGESSDFMSDEIKRSYVAQIGTILSAL